MRGVYDMICRRCNGDGKLQIVDRDKCDQYLLDCLDQEAIDEAAYRAEELAERRAGA